uniref:Peptidase C1A papain C-terminal domain-containing protein n=1 Tax=Chromera velia CCMP2878 TaxID=1169474 RepID=A0A0G4I1U4_9ALVE|eukprot:Cvel_10216.t1-p1 / transcript=Cvel_10216.t1 / gene=Cvel_10216 / organism=Chromera_velia_CCMP2878 / gene_product=hypothetical protein / transcript_product=hypothetical protein / location=Cvel_scaffold611:60682-62346(+) / protein_length=555 / sequence_SO=supercontig / SO=protein_coding / is_pseudo=false
MFSSLLRAGVVLLLDTARRLFEESEEDVQMPNAAVHESDLEDFLDEEERSYQDPCRTTGTITSLGQLTDVRDQGHAQDLPFNREAGGTCALNSVATHVRLVMWQSGWPPMSIPEHRDLVHVMLLFRPGYEERYPEFSRTQRALQFASDMYGLEHREMHLREVETQLRNGAAVSLSMRWPENSKDWARRYGTGAIPRADLEGMEFSGRHSVIALRITESDGVPCLLIKNSHGIDWGDRGFFGIPVSALKLKCLEVKAYELQSPRRIDTLGSIPQLRWTPDLETIRFSNCPLGDNGVEIVAQALEHLADSEEKGSCEWQVDELEFEGCEIGPRGVKSLFRSFLTMSIKDRLFLTHLSIDGLCDQGLRKVARGLKTLSIFYDLKNLSIGVQLEGGVSKGASKLISVLAAERTKFDSLRIPADLLHALPTDLSGRNGNLCKVNVLSVYDCDIEAIDKIIDLCREGRGQLLRVKKKLSLRMRCSENAEEDAEHIIGCCGEAPFSTLQELCLSQNFFQDTEALLLAEAMEEDFAHLRKLDLQHNQISAEVKERIGTSRVTV